MLDAGLNPDHRHPMIEITLGHSGGFWSPPIVAAFISGGIALVTGTIVSFIAWRQWRTAQDKLALELFDKRFECWKKLEKSLSDYLDAAETRYISGKGRPLPVSVIHAWTDGESDSHWLFGPEVFEMARLVGLRLARVADHSLELDFDGEPDAKTDRFTQVICEPVYIAFRDLRTLAEPYMMLDKIAVNRPSKPFPWPWSDRASKA